MAEKPCFDKSQEVSKRYNLPFRAKLWPAITRQQIDLESNSNPVKTREDVCFRMKKKCFKIFTWGFWLRMS